MSHLNMTLVQTSLAWEDRHANLSHFDSLLSNVGDTDLVILPEMFSTGFSMRSSELAESMQGDTMEWLAVKARDIQSTICGSLIVEEQGHYYNRLIWMRPDQSFATYDKRHLFRMADEHRHYSAGESRLNVEINGFRICPLICYDLRFPVWSRNINQYDVAVYVANWPAARSSHWSKLLAARAIENLSYVVGVNRIGVDGLGRDHTGDSVVLDYAGDTLLSLGQKEGVASVSIEREALMEYRNVFPADRDADQFVL